MTGDIERVSERHEIADGVALWDKQVPSFALRDWHVEEALLSPSPGVTCRCWGNRVDGEMAAFAAVKYLDEPVGDYDPDESAWLSLFAFDDGATGRAAGRALLDAVGSSLRERGQDSLRFACSPRNLLAGVPDAAPDRYAQLLEDAGFEFGDVVYDLEREIAGYTLPEAQRETAAEWPELDVVPATGREDELLAFLADQFPGRWHYEARAVCRVPGGPRDFWLLRHEGDPVGFLRSNRHDGTYRGSNVNWGARFSEAHCGVGPLGIHEDYRGRGWGLYMIAAVLERLAGDGYDHCVIDWTHLDDYYAKLGFETWVGYHTAVLDIGDGR